MLLRFIPSNVLFLIFKALQFFFLFTFKFGIQARNEDKLTAEAFFFLHTLKSNTPVLSPALQQNPYSNVPGLPSSMDHTDLHFQISDPHSLLYPSPQFQWAFTWNLQAIQIKGGKITTDPLLQIQFSFCSVAGHLLYPHLPPCPHL